LRVRVVARGTNYASGIHLLGSGDERLLTNFPVTLGFNGPGGRSEVAGEIICPPPEYNEGRRPKFWGVFALLEEQSGDNWFTLDSEFVDYGHVPPGGDGGLNFGLGRTFEPRASGETNVVDFAITNATYAADHSTAELVFLAVLRTGAGVQFRSMACTNWTFDPSFPVINNVTNAFLIVGPLERTTNVQVRATTFLDGDRVERGPVTLPLYKRPFLIARSSPAEGGFLLTLSTEPGRRYLLESSAVLAGNSAAWTPLMSNALLSANFTFTTNLPSTNAQRFFRARLLP
jgi:hypothetical protein